MADITVTGAADFNAVTNGIRRIGAESDRVSKKSSTAAMSILELSRGIEDFAVAGMRGATNNIPGFIMSLGVGAGIAGAATIALVGINELTKGIDGFLEKAQQAKEAKFAEALFDFSGAEANAKAAISSIARQIDMGAAKMRDLQDMVREGNDIRSTNTAIASAKAQEEAARRGLELLKAGKSEEEGRADAIAAELKALEDREASQRKSIEAQRMATAGVDGQIDAQNKVIEKYAEMAKAADAARRAAIRGGFDKDVSVVGKKLDRWSYIERDPMEVFEERAKNVKDAMDGFNRSFDQQALKQAEIQAGIASKALEDLRQRKDVSAESLRVAELENDQRTAEMEASKRILEIEKETLKVKKDQADIAALSSREPRFLVLPTSEDIRQMQELIANMDEQWNQAASKMRIDGSGMLSSVGRIGGSGAEFQASIATINWQRESLSQLKKIEKNTRNNSTTYR